MPLRKISKVLLILTLIGLAPLLLGQKIKSDFNPGYKFTGFKTFSFLPLKSDDPLNSRPDVAGQIRSDLKTQLERIGLVEDDTHPDFLVAYSASKESQTSTYRSAPSGWNSQNEVWTQEYSVGTLVADFIDPVTKQAFWRGTATETVYSGTMKKYIPKGVRKIVEAFDKDRNKQRQESLKR
jgi:hypothetical protein